MRSIPRWVLILTLVLVIFLTFISFSRVYHFNSDFDMYNNENVFINSLKGKYLYSSSHEAPIFAVHMELIDIIIVPIYYLFPSTLSLLFLQALVFSISLIGIYLFCREKIQNKLIGNIIVIIFLLHPFLISSVLFDFHTIMFVVPTLIFCMYFFEIKKHNLFFIFLIIFLSLREDLALIGIMISLYFFLRGNKRIAFKTLIICFLWLLVSLNIVLVLENIHVPSDSISSRFSNYGEDISSITKNFFLQPEKTIQQFIEKKEYLFNLMKIHFFLPIVTPISYISMPYIIINVLMDNSTYITCLNSQANLIIYTSLFLGLIYSLSFLERKLNKRKIAILFIIIIIFSISNFLQQGVFFTSNAHCYNTKITSEYFSIEKIKEKRLIHRELNEILDNLKKGVPIYTTHKIMVFLKNKDNVNPFNYFDLDSENLNQERYYIYDLDSIQEFIDSEKFHNDNLNKGEVLMEGEINIIYFK